jgi:hypothetical protein
MQIDTNGILKNDIIKFIFQEIENFECQNISFSTFHYQLQHILKTKSSSYNLSARVGYPTILEDKKIGFLDVIWLDGEKPIFAFEIDSNFDVKSILKLLYINSEFRFWIHYGEMTTKDKYNLKDIDKHCLITLINYPVLFNLQPEDLQKLKKLCSDFKRYESQ